MSSTFERKGNAGTLVFTIPATEVDAAFKNAVTKIANNVNIPGFRKGKAPRKVIENHYGIEAIKSEAFQMVVNKAYQKALEEHKLVPVADPKLEDEKFEEGKDASFKLTMTLKPEPELGEYKGLGVEKKVARVTAKQVEAAMEELRNRHAHMVVAPEGTKIEKGDFAIIDFAGTVGGEPFSGGEGKGYPLEVGSNSFIPGFEDQLVGLGKGESTDVKVTFPKDYFVEELAGKEAVFKVNIQDVKRKEAPELTDEYVAKETEYKTVAELKEGYKERLKAAAERDAQIQWEHDLITTAVKNAKFDVPAVMIEDRITQMVEELKLSLESRRMNLETYMKYTGQDMAKIRENQKEAATENVKADIVLDAIAKKENIQVDMNDVDGEISAIASQHGAKLDEVKKIIRNNGSMGLLLANILRRKAARIIIDSATKAEKPAKAEKEAKGAKEEK
ncbi:MAG: trigger factor [Acidaminococcaceae bacterium]|nr:trigger factor [Acidaminococcaceae bacterium]